MKLVSLRLVPDGFVGNGTFGDLTRRHFAVGGIEMDLGNIMFLESTSSREINVTGIAMKSTSIFRFISHVFGNLEDPFGIFSIPSCLHCSIMGTISIKLLLFFFAR